MVTGMRAISSPHRPSHRCAFLPWDQVAGSQQGYCAACSPGPRCRGQSGGLVAAQTPRVKAPPLRLVPVSICHQGGDVGAEVELGPQERGGWAAGLQVRGAQGSQGSWGQRSGQRGALPG